jgi:glycosyltransferase involved in cell wall biosynthesis
VGLAAQTRPLDRVLIVDNASTDGTGEAITAFADRLPLEHLRLRRNGGGAEGFHYGVREALRDGPDWLWLMDDDCEPAPDALERLLGTPAAIDPATAAVVPAVVLPDGEPLPMHRGRIVRRLLRAPIAALPPASYAADEAPCDFASFVGPLVRGRAAAAVGPPLREAFVRFEDLEYSARLRSAGAMRLVPSARVVHKEGAPVTATDLRTLWADFSRGARFDGQWKGVDGLRNVVFAGRRHGFVGRREALSYLAVQAVRIAAFDDRKLRTLRLYATYAYDGWRGRFRNVPPARWPELARVKDPIAALDREALRYDTDVAEPVRRLSRRAGDSTPAA